MPTVTIDETSIFYRDHAGNDNRPPLLLIHGAGGTLLHWPPLLRRLPTTRVIAVDLPGHGNSDGAGKTTIAAYAEFVASFLDALALPSVVLAGHSMGGAVALETAHRWPNHVARLALIATGARLSVAPVLLAGLQDRFVETAAWIAEQSFSSITPDELLQTHIRHLQATSPTLLYHDFLACDQFDGRSLLSTIRQPTLVICGTADQMTPPRLSRRLAEQISDSTLQLIDGAGHMVMLEEPELVTNSLIRFLAAVP